MTYIKVKSSILEHPLQILQPILKNAERSHRYTPNIKKQVT